ncbi:MAG: Holliday junction resolvase RuvX [Salinivirgaceae bacterium]|jgi:putative Holliday junction resolvase|nr:Holliday junction resolvase RuvX [Salinivirgaceae bacterium]
MGRIIAIDYGRKRTGIAVTDPLQMIANGLTTVQSSTTIDFLKQYFVKEKVDAIVVGHAKQMNNTDSESMQYIKPFIKQLSKHFPEMPVYLVDERFTSKIAHQTMIDGGLKKKKRQDKALVDTISATIILQSYMEQKDFGFKF